MESNDSRSASAVVAACDSTIGTSSIDTKHSEGHLANIVASRVAPSSSCSCNEDTTQVHTYANTMPSRKRAAKKCTPTNTMMHLAPLLVLTQLLSITSKVSAQSPECSCSPQQFVFKLALSAECPPLPPPFPPNDVFGAGVKDYTCTIGPEPIPNAAGQVVTSEDTPLDEGEGEGGTRRNMASLYDYFPEIEDETTIETSPTYVSQSGIGKEYKQTVSDYFPEFDVSKYEVKPIEPSELEWSSVNFTSSAVIIPGVDTVPVSIYSIQFLEVDMKFNVINQDSTYVRGIDFVNGDTFNYTSISAKRPGVVPGGMNMVLRGVNAAGEPVRNVFTITYTNDCGVPTFEVGEDIGWVSFDELTPASEATCREAPAPTTPPPTPTSPTTPKPTMRPSSSKKPTSKMPTPSWGWSASPPSDGSWMDVHGKSSKSKSSKSKSSKSSKGSKSSKSSHKSDEDGSSWRRSRTQGDEGRTRKEPIRQRDLNGEEKNQNESRRHLRR